ncbi:hypothetical protein NDU88_005345 [Pleurodeles waltl]|uniref:Uncharacterized protein n=1 Tax=Pleurodeles waltl TaxID=8319 RepID=A0AAV7WAF9_PLEWA|nr:hypothetical protein NDU88_005345 [Pleurodeles waltl]
MFLSSSPPCPAVGCPVSQLPPQFVTVGDFAILRTWCRYDDTETRGRSVSLTPGRGAEFRPAAFHPQEKPLETPTSISRRLSRPLGAAVTRSNSQTTKRRGPRQTLLGYLTFF